MFASEVVLGVRPAKHVTFIGDRLARRRLLRRGVKPVSIWLSEEYSRAAPGGTGAAKTGGNYAARWSRSRRPPRTAATRSPSSTPSSASWVEELGGMNLYFVHDDGTIVTPELTGSILEGITRDSSSSSPRTWA